ncbi:MAG TPA: TerC family protein [Acidimicrobiia bacterium]|nr:TerC family protein [Acidimicrobiia bacterium]
MFSEQISRLAGEAATSTRFFAELEVELWHWVALLVLISALLIIDLLVVHREAHVISTKEAAIESAVWISIGFAFTGVIAWLAVDGEAGRASMEYLSGFLVEKSLSVDNVFVWAVIFGYFGVPREYQFRVLFWGIFGALVLRGIFIAGGVALINAFDWILYVFGAFLLYTAWKISHHDDTKVVDYEKSIVMRTVRRLVPSTSEYDGQKLFTKENGKRVATPLFAVLILIEATDVVFAVDSVPAILAISREPFIVYASNAFAILGLRALFFLLGSLAGKFRFLNLGLGVILGYVGIKMLLVNEPVGWHPPTYLSLSIIAVVLTVAIWASVWADKRDPVSAKIPKVGD